MTSISSSSSSRFEREKEIEKKNISVVNKNTLVS